MSETATPPALPTRHPTDDPGSQWHALPPRGARLMALGSALTMGLIFAGAGGVFLLTLREWRFWPAIPAIALVAAALSAWVAVRRHRRVRWRLDEQGLALVRGHWWRTETHVPLSRVQHLDLRRGPLDRIARLSTVVVHTAGTRLNSVAVAGLDERDAEHLRDRLARQLDLDDDAL